MSYRHQHPEKNGFTLVELMVVMAVGSIVLVTTVALIQDFNKMNDRSSKISDSKQTKNLAEKAVSLQFEEIAPSLGALSFQDENGENFFDYVTNVSCSQGAKDITLDTADGKTRVSSRCDRKVVLSLSPGKDGRVVTQFTYAKTATPGSFYGVPSQIIPAKFYSLPASDGKSEWLGLNNGNFFSNGPDPKMPLIDQPFYLMWTNAVFLQIYSPGSYAPIASESQNGSQAPELRGGRPYQLIGRLLKGGAKAGDFGFDYLKFLEAAGTSVYTTDPRDAGNKDRNFAKVSSGSGLDLFLRLLPPLGGSAVLAFVRPIEITQISLEPDDMNPSLANSTIKEAKLVIRTLKLNSKGELEWQNPQILANGIEKITLTRANISSAEIFFEVRMAPKSLSQTPVQTGEGK